MAREMTSERVMVPPTVDACATPIQANEPASIAPAAEAMSSRVRTRVSFIVFLLYWLVGTVRSGSTVNRPWSHTGPPLNVAASVAGPPGGAITIRAAVGWQPPDRG